MMIRKEGAWYQRRRGVRVTKEGAPWGGAVPAGPPH